ncbi:MAG TPA: hypothetical protein VN418_06900 [Gammaproteobacteria bacterium]|nr:hypothetical protein [Gammaproteobacteria bacterium]
MSGVTRYVLQRDRQGVLWDLLLYVPTVVVLGLLGLKMGYGENPSVAYILYFMASFFFIAGANRILKTRLMWLPTSPVAIETSHEQVRLELRNGERVQLVKDVRYYSDTQGKSIGLSGKDVMGQPRQFILHRGQFQDAATFKEVREALAVYK